MMPSRFRVTSDHPGEIELERVQEEPTQVNDCRGVWDGKNTSSGNCSRQDPLGICVITTSPHAADGAGELEIEVEFLKSKYGNRGRRRKKLLRMGLCFLWIILATVLVSVTSRRARHRKKVRVEESHLLSRGQYPRGGPPTTTTTTTNLTTTTSIPKVPSSPKEFHDKLRDDLPDEVPNDVKPSPPGRVTPPPPTPLSSPPPPPPPPTREGEQPDSEPEPEPIRPFSSPPRLPLSRLDPVRDLGFIEYELRPADSMPPAALTEGAASRRKALSEEQPSHRHRRARAFHPLPTNAWYQNLLLLRSGEPTIDHRVHAIPYIVDATGPVPGLRVHPPFLDATDRDVRLEVIEQHGLTLGAAASAARAPHPHPHTPWVTKRYTIEETTPLGVTLRWDAFPMSSSIVKGMPYATMCYDTPSLAAEHESAVVVPTIASEISLASNPVVDSSFEVECRWHETPVLVEREIELHFQSSDFTWLIFFSKPVRVQCLHDNKRGLQLQVVDDDPHQRPPQGGENAETGRFCARIALANACTSGLNPHHCLHQEQMPSAAFAVGQGAYGNLLRLHSHLYPGPHTAFDFAKDEEENLIVLSFDWDAQNMGNGNPPETEEKEPRELLVFALPHHLEMLGEEQVFQEGNALYCMPSLTGPACLLEGSKWTLLEDVPEITPWARRPPSLWSIPMLARSLEDDLTYRLPEIYRRGAGDTYFSGKRLAKLARVLLVAEELGAYCRGDFRLWAEKPGAAAVGVCPHDAELPSEKSISDAVTALRSSVEVWINGASENPFVFDPSWGGIISCGCVFNGNSCQVNPSHGNCPAFSNHLMNFGNAFYNDMHFHYGYHIYAAAVVAHFDPHWGRRFFERVLLLIRCIANPSEADNYFTTWRHKDWYNGHSWASGIDLFRNGRNQESSSEAIAAYEAIALYGKVMVSAWEETGSVDELRVAQEVLGVGQVLAATELRSTRRYWHVSHERRGKIHIFPPAYQRHVVGIMWQTAAQFTTWFGYQPYLVKGIQLLPLTPISEYRDDIGWAKEMYPSFARGCDHSCVADGWSVLQLAMLATVGHPRLAAERALHLPPEAFYSPGGDGHSLSNTLWYIATRAPVEEPLVLAEHPATKGFVPMERGDACLQRIAWLIRFTDVSQAGACVQAAYENPTDCSGYCDRMDPDPVSHRRD